MSDAPRQLSGVFGDDVETAPLSRRPGRQTSKPMCPDTQRFEHPSHPVMALADQPFVLSPVPFSLLLSSSFHFLIGFPSRGRRVSYPPGLAPESTHQCGSFVALMSRSLGRRLGSRSCSLPFQRISGASRYVPRLFRPRATLGSAPAPFSLEIRSAVA
jgi:hypothetical protein